MAQVRLERPAQLHVAVLSGEADGFTRVFPASWAPLSRCLPPQQSGGLWAAHQGFTLLCTIHAFNEKHGILTKSCVGWTNCVARLAKLKNITSNNTVLLYTMIQYVRPRPLLARIMVYPFCKCLDVQREILYHALNTIRSNSRQLIEQQ